MTCEDIESTLKLTLNPSVRRANNAQISPQEQEERERNCRRYKPVLLKYKATIQDCQCTYSETLEALSIVESNINWIEWEEIECPLDSTDYTVETGVQEESTELGSYKANISNSKKGVSLVSVTERFVEMDPVMKEVLSDFSALIQKRHITELQELITACLRLTFSDLTISRSAVLHQTVQRKNQLQEIISRISDLGIEVEKQSSKPFQHQLEPLDGPQHTKNPEESLKCRQWILQMQRKGLLLYLLNSISVTELLALPKCDDVLFYLSIFIINHIQYICVVLTALDP